MPTRIHPTVYERPLRILRDFDDGETARHDYRQGGYYNGAFQEDCCACGASVYVHREDEDDFLEEALDWTSRTVCPVALVRTGLVGLDRAERTRVIRFAVRMTVRSGGWEPTERLLAALDPSDRAAVTAGDLRRLARQLPDRWTLVRADRAGEVRAGLAALRAAGVPGVLEAALLHPNPVVRGVAIEATATRRADGPGARGPRGGRR